MGRLTRRHFLIGSGAVGLLQLIPFSASGGHEPENHVFVVGDLHLTRDNSREKSSAILSSLVSLSEGRRGFHVIFNGDIVEFPNLAESCVDGKRQWDEFARLYVGLKRAGFIPHLVFGNHDGSKEFAESILSGLVPSENMGNSTFSLGNNVMFILLSAIHPREFDTGFLSMELQKSRGKRAIIATHFPPDSITYIERNRHLPGYSFWRKEEVLHLVSEAGFPLVCSHSHAPFAGAYHSRGIAKPISVVSTPSVTYTLPYMGTKFVPPRVLGITVLDTRNVVGGAKFFDGKKAFRPQRLMVESRKGRYLPKALMLKG